MKLSAVVLTKNEENNIEKCLQSLDFCDEIIVIDDFSTDATVSLTKRYKTRIFTRKLQSDFAAQRNYAAEKTKGEWLLYVDADEIVSNELARDIIVEVMRQKTIHDAYYIRRRDHFLDKIITRGEVLETYEKGLIRLVKKDSGIWQGEVHEVFITKGKVGRLSRFIDHYPHPTVTDFIKKINYYSSIRANELYKRNKKVSIFEIMFVPFSKFIYTYIVRQGFLDGSEGFIYSFFMSFHSFLVRAKLHLLRFKNTASIYQP